MNAWIVGQAIINGFLAGGVYSLVGVGMTIIFGVMKMVNFAAGSYLVWGMYFTYFWQYVLGGSASPYLLIPLVVLSMIVFGYVSFKLTVRRVLNTSDTSYILITVGLMFFLQNLAETFLGTRPLSVYVPETYKNGSITLRALITRIVPSLADNAALAASPLGSLNLGFPRLIAFAVMLLLVLGVNILLTKTLLGRAMRATAENSEVAKMLGVDAERTYTIAFILGVTLAALAGLLVTPLYYVSISASVAFRTAPLMVIVLGGMGSIKGSFFGGILVGIVEALVTTLVDTQLSVASISILFLIVIYLRPQGLFGKKMRTA
ncbi:MAG: branched-chain amino acid ABC transporter permease [Treponema sp.]|jgi:branched-chain amino acid transport system permease protein|nr:branched-chain amino acid ABC transporter permease [Treponema sp.]